MVRRFAPVVLSLLVLVFVVGGSARAEQAAPPIFLPPGSVKAETLIAPPPALDSAAFKEQMAIVLWLQKTRTLEQVAFVETVLDVERFAPILGDALMTVDGRLLKDVIDEAINQVRAEYDALKGFHDLPRPFVVNDAVDPVGDARPVASYPSGHSIRAIVYARLLAEVFPDHEAALMELAHQVGYGRVIAGVHYPIDVTAGQTLGTAYADVIVQQPDFKAAVADIKGR
ncbi:MAG: phosphatase PAP2 family protein [Pseudomonadota bacterium]